jgi:HK97 family phage prohead protease
MPKPQVQFRNFAEVRTDTDRGGFDGYASTFWTVDSYGTAFAPGAYKRSIGQKKRDDGSYKIPVLFQHDPGLNVGIPTVLKDEGKNGKGLYAEATLFDDGGTVPGTGSVTLKQLRQGAVYALSVGFRSIRDRSAEDDDPLDMTYADPYIKKLPRNEIRVIEEVELWEFSVVTFEANQAAQIDTVRSDEEMTALALALNELRAGTLSPDRLALIDELVSIRTAPGSSPVEETPTAPDHASRNRDIAIAITLANYQNYLELTA